MIVPLSRPYAARGGVPVVEQVDRRIFELTYFHHCMACNFCHDSCCQYGATIEEPKVRALLQIADDVERHTGEARADWFVPRWWDDPTYPGRRYSRTQIQDTAKGDRCVFASQLGRGCMLHTYALERGVPVHDLKPMACILFPVLWDRGRLIVPVEIDDQTLVCRGSGVTLYRSARGDLEYYFGPDLIAELDRLERETLADPSRPGVVPLPLASA